jgi:hypothetical protein
MPATKKRVLGYAALATSLVVAAFVTGATTIGASQQRPDAPFRADESACCEGPGPDRLSDGVPAGYERSGRGAVAAATNAVAVLGDPRILESSRRARVLDALSARGASSQLSVRLAVAPAVEDATGLLSDVAAGRPVVAWVVPVASRLVAHTPDTATVQVWTVAVLGTDRLGAVISSWSTETLGLVWERGDWRIRGYDSRSGPVPAATQPPTPLAETLAATEQIRGFIHAPAR